MDENSKSKYSSKQTRSQWFLMFSQWFKQLALQQLGSKYKPILGQVQGHSRASIALNISESECPGTRKINWERLSQVCWEHRYVNDFKMVTIFGCNIACW